MSIYILNVVPSEEEGFIMPFTTLEKANNFIKNNFKKDSPRKVTDTLYEGKNNSYVIDCLAVDQESF